MKVSSAAAFQVQQLLFGDRKPFGLRLAQIFGRALHLKQQFVEHYFGLGVAAYHAQQHAVSDPGLRAGKVGCERMVFLERLVDPPDLGQ